MRKIVLALAAAVGIGFFTAPVVAAVPANPVETTAPAQQGEPSRNVQEARLYCHRNGVFLHWGPCAHDRWRYGYRPYGYRPYRPIYRPYYRPYRPYYRPYRYYRRW